MEQYRESNIKRILLMESICKRPGMYVGSLDIKGVYVMIENFLLYLIMSHNLKEITIQLCNDGKIRFTSSNIDVLSLIQDMHTIEIECDINNLKILHQVLDIAVLIGLSESLLLQVFDGTETHIIEGGIGEFKLEINQNSIPDILVMELLPDKGAFKNIDLNFESLNSILRRIAYLNNEIKIVSVDNAHDEYQRCVFRYPRGIFQKMDDLITERTFHKPSFRLDIDAFKDNYNYRIALCSLGFATSPYMQSFAGYGDTLYHGSLIDGIVKGIRLAVEDFSVKEDIPIEVISDDILEQEGFMIIASVMGDNLVFGGSMKIKLDMPDIEIAAQQIVYKELSKYFEANTEKARNFVNYFRIND